MKFGKLGRERRVDPDVERVRAARIEAARKNPRWTELEQVDLVPRGPFLVSAESDAIYLRCRGVVFEPGSAGVIADQAPLYFYIDADTGAPIFLEQRPGPTWSELTAKRARRSGAAA